MEHIYLYILISIVLSALMGFISIPKIMNYCQRHNLYDIPNERKVHKNGIPRLGGIAFFPCGMVAFIAGMYMIWWNSDNQHLQLSLWSCFFFVSLLIIYIVGLIDDIIGLNAKVKFTAQIISAMFLPLSGLYLNNLYGFMGIESIPFWVGAPLTIFLVVFIDNAFNLIDGIDGLAAGLALLALTGFLYCFTRETLYFYSLMIASMIGVLIPYLYFNLFGKAEKNRKIFMGDSGSLSLGFILSFLFIKFVMNNPHVMPFRKDSLMIPFTLLIVPCFDVVRVSLGRLVRKSPIFQADKTHIHHLLMQSGLHQKGALVTILLLAINYIVVNMSLFNVLPTTWIVLLDILIYIGFFVLLHWITAFRKKRTHLSHHS